MTTPTPLESACSVLEQQFEQISLALIRNDPAEVLNASSTLQKSAVVFFQAVRQLPAAELKRPGVSERIAALAYGLSSQRETMVRQSVLVERALNALVPATCKPTYAIQVGPYGSPGTSRGMFKVLAT